jgi:hypothetical protein
MRNKIPGLRRPWQPLLSAITGLAGPCELLRHVERPWASVTFTGTRHTLSLGFAGLPGIAAGEAFIAALPDHEFSIPRQVVIDAAVVAVEHEAAADPKLTVEVELLLLEDA